MPVFPEAGRQWEVAPVAEQGNDTLLTSQGGGDEQTRFMICFSREGVRCVDNDSG
jgi:hypothetical protein